MSAPRIASLLASGTEILYALGLGDRVVAVSHECDYPAEVGQKPRVTRCHVDATANAGEIDRQVRAMVSKGMPLYELDVEGLARLKPDLMVTQAQCEVCAISYDDVLRAVAEHEGLKAARVVALNPTTLEAIWADILRVGEASGASVQAEAVVGGLRRRVRVVEDSTGGLDDGERPRVVCLEWVDPLMPAGNWIPELIELAGGKCQFSAPGRHSDVIEWSRVVAFDPQIIVVMPCGFDLSRSLEEARSLTSLPRWADLTAAKTRQVYVVDGNAYFNRSGPRVVDSLEILAAIFHPDRFSLPPHIPGPTWQRLDLCG
ncbi:MAG: cobalamin-binding protein [Phycisphaerae bacterium]